MKGFVLSVLGIAAAVAILAPRAPHAATRAVAVAGPDTKAATQAAKPAWYGGAMVLDRADDGHFYATARIDSGDYRMLVDTGASIVALTGDDARAIGLTWDANALAPVAQGASGPVMGVPVTIDNIAVGDFEARDVQAVIIPEGLAVSLLGQSFLRKVPKVDIAGSTLTLSD